MKAQDKIGTNAPNQRVPALIEIPGTRAQSTQSATTTPAAKSQIVNVRIVDWALQALPAQSVQQLTLVKESPYDPSRWPNDQTQVIEEILVVPANVVYVITDIIFYALRAGVPLVAPPIQLEDYQLSGSFVFDVLVDNISKFNTVTASVELNSTGPIPLYNPTLSGFSRLNKSVGATKTVPFALYAREGQRIAFLIQNTRTSQLPTFELIKFGVELRGVSISSALFDTYIQNTNKKGG